MPRQYSVLFISLFAVLYLTGAALTAQGAMQANGAQGANTENAGRPADIAAADPAPVKLRLDTPSGLPVPRLVSLKAQKTFCRSGPSFSHPVRLTFMRAGLPVMIIAETRDHWRKIRDVEGDECWTHKSKLSGEKTALVLEDGLALRTKPDAAAPARARLGRGVIARVEGDKDGWLKVTADGRKGWARASAFWGAEAEAPLSSVVYP